MHAPIRPPRGDTPATTHCCQHRHGTDLLLHRAPIPEEEPLPGEEPIPEDDPAPHPDPVIREPDAVPPAPLQVQPKH